MGSEYVLSLPASSRPLDGSGAGGESWAEMGEEGIPGGQNNMNYNRGASRRAVQFGPPAA